MIREFPQRPAGEDGMRDLLRSCWIGIRKTKPFLQIAPWHLELDPLFEKECRPLS